MSGDRPNGPTEVIAAGVTDVGRTREINEDNILVEPTLGLFVVADGMGGHSAGNVASALASKTLTEFFQALSEPPTSNAAPDVTGVDSSGLPDGAQKLVSAIRKANHEIYTISSTDARHKGMGSTVVALYFSPEAHQVHIAHVGDSRCYRMRNGALEQLTRDHSLINEALAMKPDLTKAQIARLPKNVITRALGMASAVQVDVRTEQAISGDVFLLCSDGLSGLVNEQQMLDMLEMSDDSQSACEVLIALANDAGGTDNISAVVVRVAGEAPAMAAEEAPLGEGETPVSPAAAATEVPSEIEAAESDLSASEQFAIAELLRQSEEAATAHAEDAEAFAQEAETSEGDLSESEQFAVAELLRQSEEAAAAHAEDAEAFAQEAGAEEAAHEAEGEEGVIEEGVVEEGVIEEGVVEEGVVEEGVVEEGIVEEGVVEGELLEEALAEEGYEYEEEPAEQAPVEEGAAVFIAPIIDISPPEGEKPAEAPVQARAWPEPAAQEAAAAEEGEPEAEVQVEAAEGGDAYSEFGDTYVGDDEGAALFDRERSPISIVPVARCRRCKHELYIGNAFCTECGLRID